MDQEEENVPHVSLPEAIIVGMFVALADIIEIVLIFFGLDDFGLSDLIAFPATQLYMRLRGLRESYMLIANITEVVPYLGWLPLRSIGFWVTIWTTNHPKLASSKLVAVGGAIAAGVATGGAGTIGAAVGAAGESGIAEVGAGALAEEASSVAIAKNSATAERMVRPSERTMTKNLAQTSGVQTDDIDPELLGEKPPIDELVKRHLFNPDYDTTTLDAANDDEDDGNVTMEDDDTINLAK